MTLAGRSPIVAEGIDAIACTFLPASPRPRQQCRTDVSSRGILPRLPRVTGLMPDPEPLPPSERSDGHGRRARTPSPRGGRSRPATRRRSADGARPGGSAGSSVRRVVGRGGRARGGADAVALAAGRASGSTSFELEEAIGVGGMGAVFRALDTRLDRQVALKILPPEQAGDPEVVQRFYQEGRAAARLDHENIARVYTIGHDGQLPLHRLRVHRGDDDPPAGRAERARCRSSEAINYTLQIADALVHAAERGVVHRDIKPSNIIVTPQGRAKLVDMGLARRFERGGDDGLTQSGMTLGTFDYISPEQARDPRDVDVRSDLYSLGCTLFHMLTGRPPFPEGTVLQKLIQHQEEPPPDVRALNPPVPPDLASILVKLMAKDRDRRYQTPEQLVRDLLTVAGSLGLRSVSPEGLVWLSADAARRPGSGTWSGASPRWPSRLIVVGPGLVGPGRRAGLRRARRRPRPPPAGRRRPPTGSATAGPRRRAGAGGRPRRPAPAGDRRRRAAGPRATSPSTRARTCSRCSPRPRRGR